MKYLMLLMLALTSCATHKAITPIVSTEVVHSSTGMARQVVWHCQEEDINDKLVWIECDFQNYAPFINNVCISVSYISRSTIEEVVNSHKLCSGPLWTNAKAANYAAFVKEQRETLKQVCGPKLADCYMRSKIVLK